MMKKTLIAMAVLAAAGTAAAQSSVTLYGRLDASLVSTTTKNYDGVKKYPDTKTGIESSQLSTQFWGLQGTEDLGGGLKAIFKLESNFNIDDGALDGSGMFAREANVGLMGGFGTVKLGRNYHAYDTFFGAVNHTDNTNINVSSAVAGVGLGHYAVRASNSIRYESPDMSGFRIAATYGFGEDKTTTQSANNQWSVAACYGVGTLVVCYAHQTQEKAGSPNLKHDVIGAAYDFGPAKLVGSYQQAKQNTTKDKDWQLGVKVPVGAFAFYVGYADSESKNGVTKLNADGWALLGTYALSKRTTAYAGYEKYKRDATTITDTTKYTNLAIGVRHTF